METVEDVVQDQARQVVEAYMATFGGNAATQLLVWTLGSYLKPFLRFWPHMELQADKGAGESTLLRRLEWAAGLSMLSGQSTGSEFRLLTSVSAPARPVCWEEISARKQGLIDKAVALLRDSYQYTMRRHGSEMTEFVLCAPVLLAGNDVPVVGLTGRTVRASLRHKGALIPEGLPRFPVAAWVEWLGDVTKPAHICVIGESAWTAGFGGR